MGLEKREEVLTATLVSTQISPRCPLCGQPASRVHSSYTRRVADLPCAGQFIRLLIQVRKYFCEESSCPRKIFAERLTPFVEPFARVTKRLFHIVQLIGLATGGRLGVRVTDRLGIQTSRQTILRRIMALPTEPVGQVPQIGSTIFPSGEDASSARSLWISKRTRCSTCCPIEPKIRLRPGWQRTRKSRRVEPGPRGRLRLCGNDWCPSGSSVCRPFPHSQEFRGGGRGMRGTPSGSKAPGSPPRHA